MTNVCLASCGLYKGGLRERGAGFGVKTTKQATE